MSTAATATDDLPERLYVQDDGRELVINRTANGALHRNLGLRRTAGERVGIYKLDRVVKLAPSATVVEIAAEPPATPASTQT